MIALTPRQLELVRLIAQGQSNAQIAHVMGMGEQSVKNNLSGLYRSLDVADRTQAVVVAAQRGYVDLDIPSRPLRSIRDTRQRLLSIRVELADLRTDIDRALGELDALVDES